MITRITREEAVDLLYGLIGTGMFHDEINDALEDIAKNISAEDDGLHIWGAPAEDVVTLYTSVREDLITDAIREENDRLYALYKYEPSLFEQDMLGESEEELSDETGDRTHEDLREEE